MLGSYGAHNGSSSKYQAIAYMKRGKETIHIVVVSFSGEYWPTSLVTGVSDGKHVRRAQFCVYSYQIILL